MTDPGTNAPSTRAFVVLGGRATASPDFLLDDLPSTSGRLDVLVRCLRAGLLVSHGVRRDAAVYLVLRGGPRAPRVVRFRGADAKFLRPDERSLATLLRKTLATDLDAEGAGFVPVRPGIAVARGDLDEALADLGRATLFVLEENGEDVRAAALPDAGGPGMAFVLGDHEGFDAATRARLAARGACALSVGPTSLHTEDVVAVVSNELDYRRAKAPTGGTSPCAS